MIAYCANEKPFIYAIFSDRDKDRAVAVLEKLNEEGVLFWFPMEFSKKEIERIEASSACLLFLTKDALSDEKVRRCVDHAEMHNKKILCVYLEPATLSPGLELQLNSLQSIHKVNFPDEAAFFEKLRSAEIFTLLKITPAQKRFARRRGLVSVLVPAVSAVILFATIVVPLLVAPMVKAATGSLSKAGFGNLSLSELAKLDKLYVIGNRVYDRWYFAFYKESKSEAFVNGLNITIPIGSISDISDLALLKNAREIAFEANQVSDISPLYKIKSLESLTLNCNPIKSLKGIEALQNLKVITLVNTEVSDISPLFKIHSLDYISFENTYVSSIDGIESLTRLLGLRTGNSNLTDLSPLNKIDFSYLNNNSEGFSFEAKRTLVKDFSPLKRIPKFADVMVESIRLDSILPYLCGKQVRKLFLMKTDIHTISQLSSIKNLLILHLQESSRLSSIEGIESHTDLTEVNLERCNKLTDLAPLLKLPKLETLFLSKDMENQALAQLRGAWFKIVYSPN